MQNHTYDTPIIMNEAHLHGGLCDYHLCTWGKPVPVCLGLHGVLPWILDELGRGLHTVGSVGVSSATSL